MMEASLSSLGLSVLLSNACDLLVMQYLKNLKLGGGNENDRAGVRVGTGVKVK